MARIFDPSLWTPIGPGEDPRSVRFDTPFGPVEGRWWPNRIQLFYVRPILVSPTTPYLLPSVEERTESFGSLPRIGPLPAGDGPALVSARAKDLVLQSRLWLGSSAFTLKIACILALRALARQVPRAAGYGDPGLLVARFSSEALIFTAAGGGFPPGSALAGMPGWGFTNEDRARYNAAKKAATIRPHGLLPALRRLRHIRDGILEPVKILALTLPPFPSAHVRFAVLQKAETRLREVGADLTRLARDNGLESLCLEIP